MRYCNDCLTASAVPFRFYQAHFPRTVAEHEAAMPAGHCSGIRAPERHLAEFRWHAHEHRRRAAVLVSLGGAVARLDYEPAESTSRLYGGNSNWRGPIWFPVNHLIIEALRVYHRFLGDAWTVEYPRGSGRQAHLGAVADGIAARLASIFLEAADGVRPVVAGIRLYARPDLADAIPFHEYFHAETGQGLGASHQTGWTGLVADLLLRRTNDRDRYDIASLSDRATTLG